MYFCTAWIRKKHLNETLTTSKQASFQIPSKLVCKQYTLYSVHSSYTLWYRNVYIVFNIIIIIIIIMNELWHMSGYG